MNRWIANKLGLVNFWYYDIEEFELSDGKLLLRGSNGSGKSVTMQSFIPLLLDGNKAPERLDPFGTKSRKIENYLLDEDTDEKTAYLYMEFKRKESENYLTIGIGLKAIKNKPLQSWYFLVTDGRRVNKDLMLYRDSGHLIPLTKKQLENEIGDGGIYTEQQGEYMRKVNEHLFGFDDVETYDELLNLLINVRSPKLSKDFKPTEIYKILADSLKVLSEDDLRPMSESMENMDGLQTTLEEYKNSLKATENIKYHYDKYNKACLMEKGRKLLEKDNLIAEINKNIKSSEETLENLNAKFEELKEEGTTKEEELKKAESKYENLIVREEFKIKREIEDIKIRIEDNKKSYGQKEESLDNKKSQERQLEIKLKEEQGIADLDNVKVLDKIMELEDIGEEVAFTIGIGIIDEVKNNITQYDFQYINNSIKNYENKLKEGKKLLSDYNRVEIQYEELKKEQDKLIGENEKQKSEMLRVEELLTSEKEEYKVAFVKWANENREMIFNNGEDKEIFSIITKSESFDHLREVKELLGNIYNKHSGRLIGEKSIKERNILEINRQISNIEEEIEALNNMKDVEPERNKGALLNRERLVLDGINHIPLYKAVDFKKDVKDEMKIIIEKALVELGLIDALIINKKDMEKALNFGENQEDKYIISEPNFMKYNLTNYLQIDKSQLEGVNYEEVDNILQSIFLEEDKLCYLNERGAVGLGILRGKVSREDYSLKYIGATARKKHREDLIKEKEEGIVLLELEIDKIEKEIGCINSSIEILKAEYNKTPRLIHIEEGFKLIYSVEEKLKELEQKIINIENSIFSKGKELKEIKAKISEKLQGVELTHTLEAVEEALEGINEYKDVLRDVVTTQKAIISREALIASYKDSLDNIRLDIDNIYYDINLFSKKLKEDEIRLQSLAEALSAMDIEGIQKEIDECLTIKSKYPQKIKEISNELGKIESKILKLNEELNKYKETKEEELKFKNIFEEIFKEEYFLEYVVPREDGNIVTICKRLIKDLDLGESKSKEHYSNSLIESLNKNMAELREYSVKTPMIFIGGENEGTTIGWLRERVDIKCRVQGKEMGFLSLIDEIKRNIEETTLLISDEERRVFEEVLMNTISTKIKAKISLSKNWVDKINDLMESMDTSSSLKLSLKWLPKKAETEGELHISELLDILERGDRCSEDDLKKLADHFASKVKEALRSYEGSGEVRNYHTIIKEVLDYREWYEFRLYFTKRGEKKTELTNNKFFQFSGGEKAMSMYVPLFSAVYARYSSCRKECPRLISMDEAFAGVDENNIRDMFRLLKELDLDYILNSQILWGDYDTVDNLAICELIREENDDVVTVLRYHWNGEERRLIS